MKTHFVEAFGKVPRIISLLVFDTTQNPNTVRRTADGQEVSLGPGEFYTVAVSDPATVVRANPHIQSWFPLNTPTEAVINGAGMIRARGRLALFVNFATFWNVIRNAKDTVREVKRTAQTKDEGYDVSERGDTEVFVCCSLAGGTGAGTFLDVSWIVREGLGNESHMSAVLLLPWIFRKNVNPSYLVYKNTYGALKELDFFMSGHRPDTINYGPRPLNPQRAPYDLVYLLDGRNRESRVIEEIDQLNAFAAQALFLLIGSQVGVANANALDNILPNLTVRPLINGKKACYLSFGVSRLRYPAKYMVEEAAHREAVRLIREELLGGPLSESALEQEVDRFIEQETLPTEQLLDALVRRPDGGRFVAAITLAHVEPDKSAALNASQHAQNRQQALLSDLQRVLEGNRKLLLDARLASLEKVAERLIEQPNGILITLAFLRKLAARLETSRYVMNGQANEFQSKFQRVDVPSAMKVVQQATQRLLISRGLLRSALAEYAAAVTEAVRYQVEIERHHCATQFLGALLPKINDLCDKVQLIKYTAEAVLKSIEEKKNALAFRKPQEGAFELLMLPGQNRLDARQASAQEFLARVHGQLIGWSLKIQDRIEHDILEYVRGRVGMATVKRLEEGLSTDKLVHSLNQLSQLSVPLWHYQGATIPIEDPGTTRYYIYGVESNERTVVRTQEVEDGLPRGASSPTFTTTNDPQSIYQLQVEAGLPLFALTDIKEWKKEYDNPSLLVSGHALSGAESFPDLLFEEERTEALKAFALGTSSVFGIIMQESIVGSDPKYYLSRRKGLKDQRLDLGQGRVQAFQSFSSDQNLVLEVNEKIREKERERNIQELIAGMVEYYNWIDDTVEKNTSLTFDLVQQLRREQTVIEKYVQDLGRTRI